MHLQSLHAYLFSYQTNDVTADQQNSSEPTDAVKIERIEGSPASYTNMYTNSTDKDRPKEIPRSPSATVPCIFEMPTENINTNKVVVKTEKLQKISTLSQNI